MHRMSIQQPPFEFRGFDDFVEIFRAGTHTDSLGRERTYTTDDLDQIVANHSEADAAPIVIGHPKVNDPAYGWTAQLKRAGDSLLAKFRDVATEFASAVEVGRYRKRSVRIVQTNKGWRLDHVGFLGAKPPAIAGLAPLQFARPEGEYHDFVQDSYTPSVIARAMRRLREFFIEQFGADAADRVLPEFEIDNLRDHADALRNGDGDDGHAVPAFSSSQSDQPQGDHTMPDYSEADITAAEQRGRDAAQSDFAAREQVLQEQLASERQQRLSAEFQAEVDASHLTPAQAEGAVEFMLSLADGDDAQFEFSVDDKTTKKQTPLGWFRDFVKRIPRQVDMGESDAGETLDAGPAASFNAPLGAHVDEARLAIHHKALEYQRRHDGVDYVTAVQIIEQQEG